MVQPGELEMGFFEERFEAGSGTARDYACS
jgi:hypothetical protein